MADTPEAAVKKKIKDYLKSIFAWYFMPIGGPFTVAGIPDIIVCWRGYFIGIEVKAPGKKGTATIHQTRQLELIHGAGGLSILADCVEDVRLALASLPERNAA